jgi:uncharacterized membrane protein
MTKSHHKQALKNIQSQKKQKKTSWLSSYWQLGLFTAVILFVFLIVFNTVYPIKYSATGLFYNDATKFLEGSWPYRDFTFEYPPLSMLFFILPRIITSSFQTYSILYHAEVIIFILGGLWTIFDIARRLGKAPWKLLSLYILGILLIGPIIGEQFDIFPAVLTLLAIYFFWLGKTKTSWVFLALGTMIKLYPVVIAPIFLFCYLSNRQYSYIWKGIISFGLVCLAIASPFIVSSPGSLLNLVTYHSTRGLQLESTYSSILLVADKIGLTNATLSYNAGSWNLVSPASESVATWSTYILAAGLLVVYGFIFRQIKPGKSQFSRIGAYCLLCILTLLIFSKILSPQYFIWLLPMPLLFTGWLKATWVVFGLIGVLTYYIFPVRYLDLMALDTGMIGVLFVRDMLMIVMALLIGISLYRMKASD